MKKIFTIIIIALSVSAFGQIPTNGLVGYWPFKGNALDESGNGHDGTVNGATLTTDRFGNANSAYNFNGINQYIAAVNSTGMNYPNGYTISTWINFTQAAQGGNFFTKHSQGTQGGFSMLIYNGKVHFYNSGVDLEPTDVFNDGNWHNVVCVFDGTTIFIYVDNVLKGTKASTYISNTADIQIGKVNGDYFYNGKIDDIRMYSRVLNAQEIESLYQENIIINTGLIAHYPFNGNANDESGNGNNGTVHGATLTADRFGNPNSAYSFDGNKSHINVLFDKNLTDISVSFWYNAITTDTLFPTFFWIENNDSITNPWGTYYAQLAHNSNPEIYYLGSRLQTTDNIYDNFHLAPSLNTWHNVCCVFDHLENKSKIFIDGVLFGQVTTIGNFLDSKYINIGCQHANENLFRGKLDDFNIYNRPLSQSEITALYNENICFQSVTVTDTLVINAVFTGFNPMKYQNSIKIYPNPTNDKITIDCGSNFSTLTGYTIKIANSLSQTVYTSAVNQQVTTINLSTWTGRGIYFVHLIDATDNTIDIKKIVLQ